MRYLTAIPRTAASSKDGAIYEFTPDMEAVYEAEPGETADGGVLSTIPEEYLSEPF